MALDTTQRYDAMRKLVKEMFVTSNQTAQLTTEEVRLLIDNLDDYIESNATAINQAIHASIRSKATLSQKALALAFVGMKRGNII